MQLGQANLQACWQQRTARSIGLHVLLLLSVTLALYRPVLHRRYNPFTNDGQNDEDLDTLLAACERAMNGQADVKMQTTFNSQTGSNLKVFGSMADDTANGPSWQTGMVGGRGWFTYSCVLQLHQPSCHCCLRVGILRCQGSADVRVGCVCCDMSYDASMYIHRATSDSTACFTSNVGC